MPLGDRLERRAVEALVGRRAELERLEDFALGDEPVVMYIQGIPGIGKTHLLNALMARIGAKGVSVVRIDARWCEPSAAALYQAISREIGAPEVRRFRSRGGASIGHVKANSPGARQLRIVPSA
jgi:Cdc6-like AAA superfamily ATPase